MPSAPTHSPNGLSTQQSKTLFGNLPVPFKMAQTCYFENDFVKGTDYTAADWTTTTTSGSNALTAGNGGWVLLTSAASTNDIQHMAATPAPFLLTQGYPFWFGMRFKSADIVDPAFIMGLEVVGGTFTPTAGVYLTKAAAGTSLNLVMRNASTSTTTVVPGTLANGTFYTAGFYYNGNSNGEITGFCTAGNQEPNLASKAYASVGGYAVGRSADMTNFPTVALTPAFGVKADTTVARTLTVDWIIAAVASSRN
jgi:hypothetical protein